MSARRPQDLFRALLSQLDRVFVWQVSPFSFFFCFLDQSPLSYYYLHFSVFPVSVFSPSLSPTCSNPHLLVLLLCLLPVALCRALSLMYLRPPQAAVFTRPLQGGNRRRMTWSMFPAEESTAVSLSFSFLSLPSLCPVCAALAIDRSSHTDPLIHQLGLNLPWAEGWERKRETFVWGGEQKKNNATHREEKKVK